MPERRTLRRGWEKMRFRSRRAVTDIRIAIERRRAERAYEHETERRTRERLLRLAGERGLLLNMGASGHRLEGWIAVDLRPDEHGIRFDAARPWPLPDGCAHAVRSEHLIEHLGYDGAGAYLAEAFRVLEEGGVCRTVTPDLEAIARAYLERDPAVLAVHRSDGYTAPTWSHLINNYARLWGHKHLFDFDALAILLRGAGFAQLERASFGESRHAVLDGTDGHDPGSLSPLVLCVDAVK